MHRWLIKTIKNSTNWEQNVNSLFEVYVGYHIVLYQSWFYQLFIVNSGLLL